MKKIFTSTLVAALLPLSGFATDYSFTANGPELTSMPHGTAVTWGLNNTNGKNVTTGSTNSAYTNLFNEINSGGKVVISATLTIKNIYDWTGETNNGNGQYDPADALFINILGGVYSGNTSGLKEKVFDPAGVDRQADVNWNNARNPFIDDTVNTGSADWNQVLQGGSTPLLFQDAVANSLLKVTTQGTSGNTTKIGTPTGVSWSDPDGPATKSTLVITFTGLNLAVLQSLLDADSSTGSPNVGIGFAAECHYYMDSVMLNITTGNAPPPQSVPDTGNTLALMGLGMAAIIGFRRFKK